MQLLAMLSRRTIRLQGTKHIPDMPKMQRSAVLLKGPPGSVFNTCLMYIQMMAAF